MTRMRTVMGKYSTGGSSCPNAWSWKYCHVDANVVIVDEADLA
jgi:hypothetical protein